jgi:glucosamine-6-phosphate deaminase
MPFKVVITTDFDHMSEVAARFVVDDIEKTANTKDAHVSGLATGNTPTELYRYLAKGAGISKASPYGILPLAGDPPGGILQSEAEGRLAASRVTPNALNPVGSGGAGTRGRDQNEVLGP